MTMDLINTSKQAKFDAITGSVLNGELPDGKKIKQEPDGVMKCTVLNSQLRKTTSPTYICAQCFKPPIRPRGGTSNRLALFHSLLINRAFLPYRGCPNKVKGGMMLSSLASSASILAETQPSLFYRLSVSIIMWKL